MQRAVILSAAGGWIGPEELSAKVTGKMPG